jgi:nucleotide-binding universal stress UspA family protein
MISSVVSIPAIWSILGLGSAAAFIMGSVSKQVVTKANCDVLVVKK